LGALIKHLRKICGFNEPLKEEGSDRKNSGDNLEELEFDESAKMTSIYEQDWSHLENGLRLIELCYTLKNKLTDFDEHFRNKV